MKKIIVLFGGYSSNLENILNTIHNNKIEVIATFTNNKNARGIEISKAFEVPCVVVDEKGFENKKLYNTSLLEHICKFQFDLVVLAGYMRIMPDFFIRGIKEPMINIHPSLLPLHKGLDGAKKSYEDDNKYGGVSVHYVTSELDSGKIITQNKIDKSDISSFSEYEKKLKEQEAKILPLTICKVLDIGYISNNTSI